MDTDTFKSVYEHLGNNIEEIKSVIKNPDSLKLPDHTRSIERLKYLFYSLTKMLVDIGHGIILENELRDPLNRADIFISLAEREILLSSVVPGVKKAVLSLPKLSSCSYSEVIAIISESINDLHKCLDSFAVYFNFKDKKI
jgi:hypothetical protein